MFMICKVSKDEYKRKFDMSEDEFVEDLCEGVDEIMIGIDDKGVIGGVVGIIGANIESKWEVFYKVIGLNIDCDLENEMQLYGYLRQFYEGDF